VLAPDSRAHGWSGGDLVSYGVKEAEDALRWAAWLRGQRCGKFYALGESMGAAVLIQAAAKEAVFAAIVAECSFCEFRSIAEYRAQRVIGVPAIMAKPLVSIAFLFAGMLRGLDFDRASPVESARRLNTPLLRAILRQWCGLCPARDMRMDTEQPPGVLAARSGLV
jgi:uncharacterized protein